MKKTIFISLIFFLSSHANALLAMERMSNEELNNTIGQVGVTIAFGGVSTTTVYFETLSWGDSDGLGAGCGTNPGWLIFDANIGNTITNVIPDGEILKLDIGTTGIGVCNIAGNVNIPASTTFIAIDLPSINTSVSVAQTMSINLRSSSGHGVLSNNALGLLSWENLSIQPSTPDALYVWAH